MPVVGAGPVAPEVQVGCDKDIEPVVGAGPVAPEVQVGWETVTEPVVGAGPVAPEVQVMCLHYHRYYSTYQVFLCQLVLFVMCLLECHL